MVMSAPASSVIVPLLTLPETSMRWSTRMSPLAMRLTAGTVAVHAGHVNAIDAASTEIEPAVSDSAAVRQGDLLRQHQGARAEVEHACCDRDLDRVGQRMGRRCSRPACRNRSASSRAPPATAIATTTPTATARPSPRACTCA
jgi:hypothetical protein